jgi:hypothetical protein
LLGELVRVSSGPMRMPGCELICEKRTDTVVGFMAADV